MMAKQARSFLKKRTKKLSALWHQCQWKKFFASFVVRVARLRHHRAISTPPA
jgi:hypothetical protein